MSDPLDILPSDPAILDPPSNHLEASTTTFPSDSEDYDADADASASPSHSPPSSSSPLILYSPPTLWGLLRGAAINLLLPFVNGLMLGFGELVANEAAFRLGWSGTKGTGAEDGGRMAVGNENENETRRDETDARQVFPSGRSDSRRVGPGVEMRADPVERRRRNGQELDMYTALE
ncbi:mitochondrial outer membrane [Ascochyta rabiei]|uniref:Mitochondrial outer membrane n=1 Tax=Didymella rabiei TaxID=5454 RepID=A0A163LNM9_DIDRA|nr:mitochondrial outer membrane [Ascochyta rabiei]